LHGERYAVTDARRRVAAGIADVAVRQEMTITLSNVEIALRADDVTTVEKGLTSLSTMMGAYGNRASGDRAEVSAVFLVLNGVQRTSSPNSTSPIIP
jgi:alpha-D-ribose 1-methylphosphonate 5-triphosphate synthase subunit PhnG